MKRTLTILLLLPVLAQAQGMGIGFGFAQLVGVMIFFGVIALLFLVLRKLALWYWKIDTIVNQQQQNINALQIIYNHNQEALNAAKEQTAILKKISTQLDAGSKSADQ